MFSLHAWSGIIVGIFLLLIATSGAVAVFRAEIDWLATPALRVAPTSQPVSLNQVETAVLDAYPQASISDLRMPYGRRFAYIATVMEKVDMMDESFQPIGIRKTTNGQSGRCEPH